MPEVEESKENLVEPRLNKRGLRFLYGWAPAHEKMFGQTGKDLNQQISEAQKGYASVCHAEYILE